MSKLPSKPVRSALNRLIVACRDEAMALDLAAVRMQGPERKERLMEQSRRRTVFRNDLRAGVIALGGVPVDKPSLRARLQGLLRTIADNTTSEGRANNRRVEIVVQPSVEAR